MSQKCVYADLELYWDFRTGVHCFPPQSLRNHVKTPVVGTVLHVSRHSSRPVIPASCLEPLIHEIPQSWNLPSHLSSPFVEIPWVTAICFYFHLHAPKPNNLGCPRLPVCCCSVSSSLPFSSERKIRHYIWNDEGKVLSEEALRIFLNKVYVL